MIGRYHLFVYLLGKAFPTYLSKNQVVIKYFRAKIFPKRKKVSTKILFIDTSVFYFLLVTKNLFHDHQFLS